MNCSDTERQTYLILHVCKTGRKIDGEHDEDDVRLGITERPQSVVLFLSCCIPKSQFNFFAFVFDLSYVVFEYGRYIGLEISG